MWRGVALLVIFANHVPDTFFEGAHIAFSLSSAAEVFVLLAGVSAAHAFWDRFAAGDVLGMTLRVLRRALQLYFAHIATAFAAIALIVAVGDDRTLATYALSGMAQDPLGTLVAITTLRHMPAYFDILPLYVALLAMLPALLVLARIGIAPLLAVSASLYGIVHIARAWGAAPSSWFFDPLAWQLLFALGLAYGIASRRGVRAPQHPMLVTAAALLLVAAGLWKHFGGGIGDASFLTGLGKRELALPRVVHVVLMAFVVARVPGLRTFGVGEGPWSPLTAIGRHSLPIFCMGSLASLGGAILRSHTGGEPWVDVVYVALGIAAHIALATVLEHRRTQGATSRAIAVVMPIYRTG